jgi:hypothetical protein
MEILYAKNIDNGPAILAKASALYSLTPDFLTRVSVLDASINKFSTIFLNFIIINTNNKYIKYL